MWELIATLTLLLPLMSSIINGLLRNKLCKRHAIVIAIVSIILTFVLSIFLFDHVGIGHQVIHKTFFTWFYIKDLSVNWGMYIDSLGAIMLLLVTLVSSIVHVYSLGYMSDDNEIVKYLSFLSLFTFFMLALIMSDNLLQMFFGWEGVGLCSYLLIGFWYKKDSANKAAMKAFIVNRLADVALILGIIILINYTGHSDFQYILTHANMLSLETCYIFGISFKIIDIICILLLIGCMGKSAQLGFHVWLPDAMEGPTPVSALIHAATMVTAGVFLIVRCSYLFQYSPPVLNIISFVGGTTCLFAAVMAVAERDLKKIIAYSTSSQLGYMFLAIGASSYNNAIFHLITHGFFKSLLFLSAGNVIHTCREQDIFKLGGLASRMPITYGNFLFGSMALIGVYPLAGFYSKDLILESVYNNGNIGHVLFYLGNFVAILTAIYSMKTILFVFHGKTKIHLAFYTHIEEVPNLMNVALNLLVAGSFFTGMVGYYLLSMDKISGYFANSIVQRPNIHLSYYLSSLPMISGTLGILFTIYIYNKYAFNLGKTYKLDKNSFFVRLLENKFYFDKAYDALFVNSTKYSSQILYIFDILVIERITSRLTARIANCFSRNVSRLHTGYIFDYNIVIVCFFVVGISFLLFTNYVWNR